MNYDICLGGFVQSVLLASFSSLKSGCGISHCLPNAYQFPKIQLNDGKNEVWWTRCRLMWLKAPIVILGHWAGEIDNRYSGRWPQFHAVRRHFRGEH